MSVLASHLQPFRGETDGNGLGLMAEYLYGGKGVMFWLTMIGTFMILILAANTAYADFPRLASIVAKDGFLPRQFFNRGARLVFSNGVLFLAVVASGLIVAFNGDISKLIPLYAFGVFTGFTLSQSGMVVHHWRDREPRWRVNMAINLVGAVTTGVIALIVVISKFTVGAWIPAVLIPIMVAGFRAIGRHYAHVRRTLKVAPGYRATNGPNTMVVLVGSVNRGVLHGLEYAQSLKPDRLFALTVIADDDDRARIDAQWREFGIDVELRYVESPYRELLRPVLAALDDLHREQPEQVITVVIPEFVTSWSSQWLHNASGFALKAGLLQRPRTVVVSVPIHVHEDETIDDWTTPELAVAAPTGRRVAPDEITSSRPAPVPEPSGT